MALLREWWWLPQHGASWPSAGRSPGGGACLILLDYLAQQGRDAPDDPYKGSATQSGVVTFGAPHVHEGCDGFRLTSFDGTPTTV
jgi:hypothetical protein